MAMKLSILYRGPLSSCNYACGYCPFAKRTESTGELTADRLALLRFSDWVASRVDDRLAVFFTPWGEALVRSWYRDAVEQLSNLPNVDRVAIQTNLSCPLDWVTRCDRSSLAFWATYHPGEVDRARFVSRCRELSQHGIRYSAGVVGLKEHFAEIEALRRELPEDVYLWVNAYKRELGYYIDDELRFLEMIDPLFRVNNKRHLSLGRACRTGRSVISVDGTGEIRRCHFVSDRIGNIYEPGFEANLVDRACPAATCSCHIGYVHLDHLHLGEVFGSGILERIPAAPIWRR
jgi:MoaA/NifB/PqqE/SkfB family radical SAM enzyme